MFGHKFDTTKIHHNKSSNKKLHFNCQHDLKSYLFSVSELVLF